MVDILALDGQGVLSSDDEEEVAGQLHYLPVVRGGGGGRGEGQLDRPCIDRMCTDCMHAGLCKHACSPQAC